MKWVRTKENYWEINLRDPEVAKKYQHEESCPCDLCNCDCACCLGTCDQVGVHVTYSSTDDDVKRITTTNELCQWGEDYR